LACQAAASAGLCRAPSQRGATWTAALPSGIRAVSLEGLSESGGAPAPKVLYRAP